MEADKIFDAIRSIVLQVTGIEECLKTEPNAPSPSGEYCTVSISSNVNQRGQAIIRTSLDSPGSMEIDVAPQAVTEASINFYRGNAADNAQKILQANKLPSVSEALYLAGLGWQRAGPVNKITGLQAASFESRAQVSIFLLHEIRFTSEPEIVNTIEQVPYTVFAQVSSGILSQVSSGTFAQVSSGIIGSWRGEPKWTAIPAQYDRQSWLPAGLDLNPYVLPHPQDLPLSNWQLHDNPPEMTIDQNGIITFSAAGQIGTYSVSASVDNAEGTGTSSPFTWNITLHDAPVWDTVPPWVAQQDELPQTRDMNNYILEGDNLILWRLDGVPDGVTIDQNGIVTVADTVVSGTYSLTCAVQNEYGESTSNAFSLEITLVYVPDPPVWGLTPIPDQTDRDAELPVTLDLKDYLVPNSLPITWALVSPPPGVTVGPTGIITVADTTAIGSYPLTALASNDDGANVPSNEFTWEITSFEGPIWSAIPDIYAEKSDNYPISINMNLYVSGDDLSAWVLTGEPDGVAIGTNGVMTIASSATPGSHTLTCSVTNPGGTAQSAEFAFHMDGVATGAPGIDGDLEVNQTLTAIIGTLSDVNGMPDYADISWQWFAGGVLIDGATGSTYSVTSNEAGKAMKVRATFTDLLGFSEGPIFSADTGKVNAPATGQPSITGTTSVGQPLLAQIGTIDDLNGVPDIATFAWQWYQNDTLIPNETGQTYTIVAGDIGSTLKVEASFIDLDGYAEGPLVSDPTNQVQGFATGQPDITGNLAIGQTLTAGIGTIDDINGVPDVSTFTWQWYRNGVAINNATAQTYDIIGADGNAVLRVDASFVDNQGYAEGPLASENTNPVDVGAAGAPDITGDVVIGGTLTAGIGTITDPNGVPDVSTFTWQWYVDGVLVPGATQQTYQVVGGDYGLVIRVDASFVDDAGYSEGPLPSADTIPVPEHAGFEHYFDSATLGGFAFSRTGTEDVSDYLADQVTVPENEPGFPGGEYTP